MFRKFFFCFILFVLVIQADYPTGADYLIICKDSYESRLEEFAHWKTQKGYVTRVTTVSETGSSIRDYIIDAYTTWSPQPKFVLIVANVGEISMLHGGYTEYGEFDSDWQYGNMDSDIYHEVHVGRLPARNTSQLETMLDKILHYEIEIPEGDWISRGMTIVYEDYDDDDSLYWANADTAAAGMENSDFVHIDRFSVERGNDRGDVEDAINGNGCSFVFFRGQAVSNWSPPFNIDPEELENGYRTPVVSSITCHTISDYGSTEAGSWWMRADYSDGLPGGAVGFIGTTSSISGGAHLRGEVAEGLANSYFADTTNDLAFAVESGRLNQYGIYGDDAQYTSIVLLGDPEMDIRTKQAHLLTVDNTPILNASSESFSVNVSHDFLPIENALVCLTDFETIHLSGRTDSDGNLVFSISDFEADSLHLTITSKNALPYFSIIPVISEGIFITVSDYSIEDSETGNNDGVLNPGEDARLLVDFTNIGTEFASSLSASISSTDSFSSISSSSVSLGDIASGATTSGEFSIVVSADCPDKHHISSNTSISGSGEWNTERPNIQVFQADISVYSWSLNDSPPFGNGNGLADSGESPILNLTLFNSNPTGLESASFVFTCESDFIIMEPTEIIIEDIPANDFITIESLIPITISPETGSAPEFLVNMEIQEIGHTYTNVQNETIEIPLENTDGSFDGPDSYGYYCYDDTDTESGRAPSYDWFDIADDDNMISSITDDDDEAVTLPISIEYQYYGETFEQISICTNGFAAFGDQDWSGGSGPGDGHERTMPHIGEANAILAPFWKDLNPRRSGDVYAKNISTENVSVISWNNVDHYSPSGTYETFQIVIKDPEHFPTPTGDAEILFQYQQVSNPNLGVTGIESPDESTGFSYVYHGSYMENAEPIIEGRAILFSTNPPIADDFIWLSITETRFDAGSDEIISPHETISLRPIVGNNGNIDANDVIFTLTCDHPEISISEVVLNWDIISAGSEAIPALSYSLSIGSFSSDTTIILEFQLESSDGYLRSGIIPLSIKASLSLMEIEIQAGWNLLSYPFEESVEIEGQIPDFVAPAFSYNPNTLLYEVQTHFHPGIGIWVLTTEGLSTNLFGSHILSENTFNILPGWNMIGSLYSSVPITALIEVEGIVAPIYSFEGTSYIEADYLLPGLGYWVLSTDSFSISLP